MFLRFLLCVSLASGGLAFASEDQHTCRRQHRGVTRKQAEDAVIEQEQRGGANREDRRADPEDR